MINAPPVVDLPTLERLRELEIEGEPSLVAELVGEFLTRVPQRLARIRAALEAQDAAALELEAHSLVGSCGALGVMRMRASCQGLEALAHQGNLGASSAAAVEQVARDFEEARPALTQAAQPR
jgi:HPt (histidine-containing phosphotransfer) domain-containing protein